MQNVKYDVWLTSIQGIGSATFNKIISYFENSENVWNAKKGEFKGIKIKEEIIEKIISNNYKQKVNAIVDNLYKNNIQIITREDKFYPQKLKLIKSSPPILYLKGNKEILNQFSIAIVGSRNCSEYGQNIAQMFAYELAKLNVTIISGMAVGIDSIAHKSSLNNIGKTIAVLGSGFDNIYPSNNKGLFYKIIESDGAVITEYLPEVQPLAGNFPARNRIVSGLSDGVLVIEAKEKSGALITANLALKQDKKVFCVPSNIDTAYNKGGMELIKKGIKMVTSIEDVLEEYPQFNKKQLNKQNIYIPEIDINLIPEEDREIFKTISTIPISAEQICKKLNLNISKVNSSLTMLELQGYIKLLPGNRFILG